jgi:hypothetical protein
MKRGTSAVLALARILKSMWGAPYKYGRQLFTAVVAPRMDYATIVWHSPVSYNNNSPQQETRRSPAHSNEGDPRMLPDSPHICDGGRVWAPAHVLATTVQNTKILY